MYAGFTDQCMRVLLTKKILLTLVLVVGIAIIYLVLFALGLLPPYRKDVIYIAAIGRMTVPDGDGDPAMVNGIKMLINQVNQEGGIDGKKVELLLFDDDNNEDLAAARALEIAEQGKALKAKH